MAFEEQDLTRDAFLGERLHIWQPRNGYRAATDPVLLAAACPAKSGQNVLDLGCGVGTAGLCLSARVGVSVTGIEVQPDYAELARRNARENSLPLEVVVADLADVSHGLAHQSFDHVIMNPPYFGSGTAANDAGRDRALREDTPLEKWISQGLKRLKPLGWITAIHRVEALPQILFLLYQRSGSIKIIPLCPRQDREPSRVIVSARKASKAPAKLCNPLILHAGAHHLADGNDYSKEAEAILRQAKPLIR